MAALLALLAVGVAIWTRAKASARVAATVRDLSAGLGRDVELAASLDPDVVSELALAAVAWFRPDPADMLPATGVAVLVPIIIGGLFSFLRRKR